MDLRSGHAFWPIKNGLLASYPALNDGGDVRRRGLGRRYYRSTRGRSPGERRGGNGITMSVVAARLIVDDYLGRQNPDAHIYRFGR
jgi:hypothetical protein